MPALLHREADPEGRALTGLGAHADLPVVGDHDPPGERQADAVAGDVVRLPDKEGYQVVTELTGIVSGHVVMLSAHSAEEDARRGLEAGADDYITKPFRPRMLREQLEAIVARPVRAATDTGEPGTAAESQAS